MDDVSLDDLRVFHLIATEGGISAAARRSRASKATLSRALARLEQSAGTPLFDRMGQGFRLTRTGAALASVAAGTASIAKEAEAVLRAAHETPQGPLRIAAEAIVAQLVLGPVLGELHRRHPSVRAEVIVTGSAPNPLVEDIDVMLRIGQPTEDYLVVRRIMRSPLHLYIPAAKADQIDVEDPMSIEALGRVVIQAPGVPEDWVLRADDGSAVSMSSPPSRASAIPRLFWASCGAATASASSPPSWVICSSGRASACAPCRATPAL